MIKKTAFLLALVTLALNLSAQTGKFYDLLTMDSEILDMERKYAIYLPPDYETSQRSYPVLYLLHGGGDDQTGWIQFGEVLHIADKPILEGWATPMIIVMPDGNEGQRGYFNDLKNVWRYEDFLFEGNSLVHIAMRKKEIPHELWNRNGVHTWTYWRESLLEGLSFISDAFHQY